MSKKLYDGDMVIMVTDGVMDSLPATHQEALMKDIIMEHEDVLHKCAKLLLEKEKINRAEFEALFETYYPQPEEPGELVQS